MRDLVKVLLAVVLLAAATARAAEIEVRSAALHLANEGLVLDAEFVITSYSIHYTKLYEVITRVLSLRSKLPKWWAPPAVKNVSAGLAE